MKCPPYGVAARFGRQRMGRLHEHVVTLHDISRPAISEAAWDAKHYAFPDVATWVEKHNRYSNWEALQQVAAVNEDAAGLDPGLARKRRLRRLAWSLPARPLLRFLYHYVWRAGFLDGYRGYVFCRLHGLV